MNFKKQLKEGLLTQNPVLVQLLGMCSTMAITTSLFNGLGMGVSVTAILICSNIVISLLRKVIVVVPAMLILPRVGGLGISGVFLAEPLSDCTCCIACFAAMLATVWFPLEKLEKETKSA